MATKKAESGKKTAAKKAVKTTATKKAVKTPAAPKHICLVKNDSYLVTIGEITQGLLTVLGQLTQFPQNMIMSALNCILIRFEI